MAAGSRFERLEAVVCKPQIESVEHVSCEPILYRPFDRLNQGKLLRSAAILPVLHQLSKARRPCAGRDPVTLFLICI
jgi:hypothetical protein